MDKLKAIELLKIEMECVSRASGIRYNKDGNYFIRKDVPECDRNCEHCDLVQDTEELLKMYNYVIDFLKHFNNSEYFTGMVRCVNSGSSQFFLTGESYPVIDGLLFSGPVEIVKTPYTKYRYKTINDINNDNSGIGLVFAEE